MPRRIRGRSGSFLDKVQAFVDGMPYLRQLSPADRMLAFVGFSLVGVVSFAYFFLISGIFSSSSSAGVAGGGGGLFSGTKSDPRLSSALRKTGLSDEELLKRGGGKRISVGPKQLDSNENAVALDIISTLNCDALQEELEREWHTVLDQQKLAKEQEDSWKNNDAEMGFGDSWNAGGAAGSDAEGAFEDNKLDDFAGQLAEEVEDQQSGDGNVKLDDAFARRRLNEEDGMTDDLPLDDVNGGFGDWNNNNNYAPENHGLKLTGRHLFCLAAEAITLPKSTSESIPDPSTHCDINSMETRDELLYLWPSARSQMAENILQKTLRLVTEHKETLRGNEVHIWYPENDRGTEGMLRVLNSGFEGRETYNFDSEQADGSHDGLYRFHDLPSKFVGANKLFVDAGSALGLTSMLISYLYPETTIVSIEPASPSWLIQNMNFRCNLSPQQREYVHPILAGVGTRHHDDNDSMMKMIWKPTMTTATRSWNPEPEFDFAVDIELLVHLRTLKAILAEATPDDLPPGTPISVLNLDCEGCEYNLIPSMHETSFNSIGVILGRTNWGYIPTIKKPSSHRARETHQRVCTHYNFAKRCKECCDFPSLEVKPRLKDTEINLSGDGESPGESTVAEVAGDLCNGFEEWAKEQKLRDIPDDFGWNEMSAFAAN